MADMEAFHPLWTSAPGATILDALRERGMALPEFAQRIGEPVEVIESLLEGRTTITIGIARRLHKVLGASVEFWMTRDFQFREAVARRAGSDEREWLSELPLADMIKFGWIAHPPHPSDELRACLDFFGVPDIHAWRLKYSVVTEMAIYRTSPSLDSRPGSVATWLRRGILEATRIDCASWNPELFQESLVSVRALTRVKNPRRFLPDMQRRFAACGVAVVVVRAPAGCRASGATLFLGSDRALMLLSSRFLSDDQFWFTVFHEAGHLILHGTNRVIVEDTGGSTVMEEAEANGFAERVIIPANFVDAFKRLRANPMKVVKFARAVGVSPGLVVGQMQYKGILRRDQLNGLKRRFAWTDEALVSRERP